MYSESAGLIHSTQEDCQNLITYPTPKKVSPPKDLINLKETAIESLKIVANCSLFIL
jgi:hypothetical protein